MHCSQPPPILMTDKFTQKIFDSEVIDMNAQKDVEIGRALLDAFNSSDLSSWEAVLAEDFTFSYPGFREDANQQAAKAFNENILVAFPDLHFEIQRTFVNGNTLAYQWVSSGTHTGPLALPTGTVPATGRSGGSPGVLISVVQDGKIVREETYWDQVEMLTQLGLMG